MTLSGHVRGGVIVLDEEFPLEEGTPVTVEVELDLSRFPVHPDVQKMRGILSADFDARQEYRDHLLEKYG